MVHLVNGVLFSLVYAAIFEASGHAGWLFGLLLGAVHAAFVGGPLMNMLLPAVHPRMGKPWTDATETPLLEPPGFLLVNYGTMTMVVTTLLHLVYGAIVGAFAAVNRIRALTGSRSLTVSDTALAGVARRAKDRVDTVRARFRARLVRAAPGRPARRLDRELALLLDSLRGPELDADPVGEQRDDEGQHERGDPEEPDLRRCS